MSRLTAKSTSLCLLAGLVCITLGEQARGALVASDNFDSYTDGSVLTQGAAVDGWASAWAANGQTGSGITRNVVDGALPGLGKSLSLGGTATFNNVAQRSFDAQTGTVYIGFLVQTTNFDDDNFIQLYVNSTSNTSGSGGSQNTSLSGGIDFGLGGAYFTRKAGADQVGGAAIHANDELRQIVLRFSKSGGNGGNFDEVAIFVEQAVEGTPDVALGGADNDNLAAGSLTSLSYLHFRLAGLESGDLAYVDNLRIATTYAESVPEPTAGFLAVIGFYACAAIRRRSRS